jgi:hypothetical protein
VDGTGRAINLLAVQKYPIAVASNGRIEFQRVAGGGQLQGLAFNPHVATAKGMTADHSGILCNPAAAGEPEVFVQMLFLRRPGRKKFHPFGDLDQALLAFPLLAAGGRNLDTERFRTVEERRARRDIAQGLVKM